MKRKFLKKSIESLLDNDVYDQIILIKYQDFKNRIKKIEYYSNKHNGGKGSALTEALRK